MVSAVQSAEIAVDPPAETESEDDEQEEKRLLEEIQYYQNAIEQSHRTIEERDWSIGNQRR